LELDASSEGAFAVVEIDKAPQLLGASGDIQMAIAVKVRDRHGARG
jgi:hypothetical protein